MRYWVVNAARLSAVLLFLLSSSAALPQNPVLKTRPKEDREERLNAAHRITMNVQVTDADGNPVSNLRAEDFSLYDNRQPRRIAAFHSIDGAALSDATDVLILLDAVNTPSPALEKEKNAIFKYLAESKKPLPFQTAFALWFNGHLSATPATTDRNEIGRAFVKLTKNVHSNACGTKATPQNVSAGRNAAIVSPATCRRVHFKDSVTALVGIAQQQAATGGRTLLIWMGSGWPVVPDVELQRLEPKQREAYDREFAEILHNLREGQVTVYSIAPGDPEPSKEFTASNAAAASAFPRIAVDEFARRTGGRVLSNSEDLVKDLHACIRDAEWYYALAFNAPLAQNGPGEMHSLEMKVNRPGLEVRTMNSYYSEPQ